MPIQATPNYIAGNALQTKQIVVVVSITGLDDVFISTQMSNGSGATYGDGSTYGMFGLYYGNTFSSVFDAGGAVRDILSVERSSMTISQKVEPEQGRASVSQFSLSFIDKDTFMTQLISPGIIIPEIMGAEVFVRLGYAGLFYPSDYLTVFRGYVSGVTSNAGMVTLQLSDPNLKRRQQIFNSNTTLLTGNLIVEATSTVPVTSTTGLYATVQGPTGTQGASLTYVQIDSEIISYDSTAMTGTSLVGATRGALGTTIAIHASGASVSTIVAITDTAMNLALQFMLSGWGGPWLSDVAIKNIGTVEGIGAVANKIQLPDGVSAVDDYNLVEGDGFAISGAATGGNDGNFQIVAIQNNGAYTNNVLVLQTYLGASPGFTAETNTAAVAALRSQYDVLPLDCGLKLTPKDVDVVSHIAIQQTWTSSPSYSYKFTITAAESSGKTFLESQVYLPIGCYSLTKRGQLSVGITKPPVGGASVVTLNADNILNPESIRLSRALNNRKFFNQIQFQYDVQLDGTYSSTFVTFDSVSLSLIGFLNTLPITSTGGTTDLGTGSIFENQANLLLSRYSKGAQLIELTVNYGAGNLIEAGDLVIINDNGTLQVANLTNGTRNLGTQYFEVENRSLDIKTGNVKLTLVSGIGAQTTDRFGIVSPSSILAGVQTSSQITISDSYGALYPGNEPKKWVGYIGQLVTVHSADYSVTGTTYLVSQDTTNQYIMNLSPPLSFTPAADYVLDIPDYPTSTDPLVQAVYKNTFAFADPQVAVVSGASDTFFDVGAGDIAKFFVGSIIVVHNTSFSVLSPECVVLEKIGNTVVTSTSLGFTPAAGYLVELIGFSYDGGAAYRFV